MSKTRKLHHSTSNALQNQGSATLTILRYVSDTPLLEAEQPYDLFGYPTLDSRKIPNCEYSVVDNVWSSSTDYL